MTEQQIEYIILSIWPLWIRVINSTCHNCSLSVSDVCEGVTDVVNSGPLSVGLSLPYRVRSRHTKEPGFNTFLLTTADLVMGY